MKRLTHRVAVLAATMSLVGLAAPPSHAERQVIKDQARDSSRFVADLQSGDFSITEAPRESRTDLTRVRIDFRSDAVVAVAKVRRVGPRTQVALAVGARDRYYEVTVGREGRVRVFSGRATRVCADAAFQVVPSARSYRFTIPLSCIGDPTTARFGFAALRSVSRADRQIVTVYDDALRDGARDIPQRVRLGQPISRG